MTVTDDMSKHKVMIKLTSVEDVLRLHFKLMYDNCKINHIIKFLIHVYFQEYFKIPKHILDSRELYTPRAKETQTDRLLAASRLLEDRLWTTLWTRLLQDCGTPCTRQCKLQTGDR